MAESPKPQKINPSTWYYEMPTHLLMVHEVKDKASGEYLCTEQFKVPWRLIDASRKRRSKRKSRQ